MAKNLDDSLSPGDVFSPADVKILEMDEDGVAQSVVIDGRRYVLADEEDEVPDVATLPDPEVMRAITPPPRRVSPLLFANMFCTDFVTLMFGWFFACFGMIFVCVFVGQMRLADVFGSWEPAGTATLISSVDGKMEVNGTKIHRHTFRITPEGGEEIECVCHSGRQLMKEEDAPREMEAEYCATWNTYRLKGTSLGGMGGGLMSLIPLFVVIFPIIGLSIVGYHFWKCVRNWLLLKYGEVTKGVVTDVSPTGTRVNNADVMRVTFEYVTADGERLQGSTSHLDVSRLTDDECEVLFYDARHPEHVFLLDSLPEGSGPEEVTGAFRLPGVARLGYTLVMTAVTLVFAAIFLAEMTYFLGFWTFG